MKTLPRLIPVVGMLSLLGFPLSTNAASILVWQSSPSPAPPYTNWLNAAHTIQEAVDAAKTGDTVVVSGGVYDTGGRKRTGLSLTNRVIVEKAITIESLMGPEVTMIVGAADPVTTNGPAAIRCVYLGSRAVLSGFTLTNGYTLGEMAATDDLSGGGVWCAASAVITNCVVTGNRAYYGGGGYQGAFFDCVVRNNEAIWYGGGVSYAELEGCRLMGNLALYGGAVSEGRLTNSVLSANRAYYMGGAAYFSTLQACQVRENRADAGGGLYAGSAYHCLLQDNVAIWGGGGGYEASFFHCELVANLAEDGHGGGVFYGQVENSTFRRNQAENGGGAYTATLRNCLLTDNRAEAMGGAVYMGHLFNCTLVGNAAVESGGGVVAANVYNSVIHHNTARVGANHFRFPYSTEEISYSCTTPLPTNGVNNIDLDPLLASESHLSAGSPCIGAGSMMFAEGVDIDGEAWLDPPCMGVDQVVAGAATGPLTVAIESDFTQAVVGFEIAFRARIEGRSTGSRWDFGDGTHLTNRPFVSHAWHNPGFYVVQLIAYNDTHPQGVAAITLGIQVLAEAESFVDMASPDPVFPYATWANAARNIQDALGVSGVAGRTVWVADGVYDEGGVPGPGSLLTNRVALIDAVILRSVNGPLTTLIVGAAAPGNTNGDGAVRCAYVSRHAVLSGFTLTNGHTRTVGDTAREMSGAGAFCEWGGILTNCHLVGNWAARDGGGVDIGTLYDCLIAGNRAEDDAGGADDSLLYDCVLTHNLARWNGGGADQSELHRCVVLGNQAYSGGAVDDSLVYQSRLTGNRAHWDGGGALDSELWNCVVADNWAGEEGGGAADTLLYNCVVTGNGGARQGGGTQGSSHWNCTITANTATERGGGVDRGQIYNSIVYYNQAPAGANVFGAAPIRFSCLTPRPEAGEGNIEDDPRLASASHLSMRSPCLDAGSADYAFGHDLDGEPWSSPPAMGADQLVPMMAVSPLEVLVTADYTEATTGFEVSFQGWIEGQLVRSEWDLGDDWLILNQPFGIARSWEKPGVYPVRLTAYNDAYPAGISATVLVQVVERPVFFVNQLNPAPAFPFQSWETAASNIQEAIGAGQVAGRLVWVTNGVYDAGAFPAGHGLGWNRIALTNAVTVQSVNGPDWTILQGQPDPLTTNGDAAVRCAYVGRGSVLSGFTLTNGFTRSAGDQFLDQSGAGAWCEEGGVVTNAVLAGNQASYRGGGIWGGTLLTSRLERNRSLFYGGGAAGTRVVDSLLSGNQASYAGGGAHGSSLVACLITNNLASRGAGAHSCILDHCRVVANATVNNGGGIFDSVASHSTFENNTAERGGGAFNSTLHDCLLVNNRVFHDGGAADESTLYNCVLAGNRASDDGGGADESTLYQCTVVGNRSTDVGGGISESRALNCIVQFNTAGGGSANYTASSWLDYCSTTPLPPVGQGNLTNNPALVDWVAGDYHLRSTSPCIDRGTNLSAFVSLDLDGLPRPLDGNGDGTAAFDLGAYEFDLRTVVPPEWYAQYGLDSEDPYVLADNPDGDAHTTYQEWVTQTDPTDASSHFRIASVTVDPWASVYFLSLTNRLYSLFYTTNLGDLSGAPPAWRPVSGQSDWLGTGDWMILTDTNVVANRFYRVGVRVP